jgi:hypothetical protein
MNVFEWVIEKFDGPGVYNNLLASAILPLVLLLWKQINRRLTQNFRMNATARVVVLIIACSLPFVFVLEWPAQGILYVLTIVAVLISSYRTVRSFSRIGIIDAYPTTIGGIDYAAALKMAVKSIDFLGIGADKLSTEPEFEAAMRRCGANGQTVRFLLSPPSNPVLEKMERRNSTTAGEYRERVIASTLRIAEIRKKWDLSIEVRYYSAKHDKDFQRFRLMFINEKTCLWSWTHWGEHRGKDNPQVVLAHTDLSTGISSAYKAFKDYFDAAWDDDNNTTKIDLVTIDRATLESM